MSWRYSITISEANCFISLCLLHFKIVLLCEEKRELVTRIIIKVMIIITVMSFMESEPEIRIRLNLVMPASNTYTYIVTRGSLEFCKIPLCRALVIRIIGNGCIWHSDTSRCMQGELLHTWHFVEYDHNYILDDQIQFEMGKFLFLAIAVWMIIEASFGS